MANEIRVRADFVAGGLSSDMAAAATVMQSAGLADLPVIGSSEHAPLTLFQTDLSGRVIQKEIVWVTAHSAGSASSTVIRSREGTSAQDWAVGDRWSLTTVSSDVTVVCTSATRPVTPWAGMKIFEFDMATERIWTGTQWVSNPPVGSIVPVGGPNVPPGYVAADGAAISRATYDLLFAEWGTFYGVGDGSTTFNVLNAKGRVVVGQDAAQAEFNTRGEVGGAKTHVLTLAEMPVHGHKFAGANSGPFGGIPNVFHGGTIWGDITTQNAGSGAAHNNLQPYMALPMMIKV